MALEGGKHVMLSYNHKSKDIVCTVYEKLTEVGIPTWMDTKGGMGDNPKRSMAKGVEDAAVICCFLTQEYQNSDACEEELTYATVKKKRIIPCMATDRKKWKPSGWLGIITAKLLYIDFYNLSEVDLNLRVRELIEKIKNQSSNSSNEPPSSSKNLFETIRQTYLQDNRIKRLVNVEKSFSIEKNYINLSMVETKEQHEKEKKLKQQDSRMQEEENEQKQPKDEILGTYEEIYGIKTSVDVDNIFKKCKDQTKKVLVLGRAGIGKSTFCQYVAYQWAKRNIWSQYNLVVLIRLRKLTDNRYLSNENYSPIDLVKKEYFSFDDLSEEEHNHFKDQYKSGKVLWILDGYDEFVQSIPEQVKNAFDHILDTQHHVLTSRPYAIASPYDTQIEIIGFTNDNIQTYVEHFFDQLKDEIPNALLEGKKLLKFLTSNASIWGIAHIPVNLELICSLWSDTDSSKQKALTMTALYDKITEWLCRRYLTKQGIKHEQMRKKKIYELCKKELRFLETLAFNAMESHEIILPPTLLEKTEDETDCSLDDSPQLLNFGILKSYDDRPTGNQIQAEKHYYFIHLSFQEFFAARHLLDTLPTQNRQKAIDFINNYKYNRRFRYVFIFASGLLAQSEYNSCIQAFWTTIQMEPLDLVGLEHMKLIIESLDQLIAVTVFPQRTHCLQSVLRSLDLIINLEAHPVRNNLLQSFATTNFLCNNFKIQNRLIQILDIDHTDTKSITYNIVSQLPISQPIEKLVSKLACALSYPDVSIRSWTCDALGNMGEKAATNEVIIGLFNALRDKRSDVRQSACEALGRMGEKTATNEVITGLINALRDKDSDVTKSAFEALVEISEKAETNKVISGFINLLRDDEFKVRSYACEAFGKMGEKAATNEVITGLFNALDDKYSSVRRCACEALAKMGKKAATNKVITSLINALCDEVSDVRDSACEALVEMREKTETNEVITGLFKALRDKNWYARQCACEALGKMCDKTVTNEVITGLINAFRDRNSEVTKSACETLAEISENGETNKVISGLVNALRDQHLNVRICACQALAKMGETAATKEVITSLINALCDDKWEVRRSACNAFGKMGETAATNDVITGLISALRDEEWHVRKSACEVLGKMDKKAETKEVITSLVNVVRDNNCDVRKSACEVLGNMGETVATNEVITSLVNALRDDKWDVRQCACKALGEMGEKAETNEVISGLINTLCDDKSDVKQCACTVLGNMGEKAATNEVITGLINAFHDEDLDVRRRACEALGKMGEKVETNEVIIDLIKALCDDKWNVRQFACVALGNMGKKAAMSEVISGLSNAVHDKISGVRRSACEALGKMGRKAVTNEVITSLINALRDEEWDLRKSAGKALGKMSGKPATNEVIAGVINILHDDKWYVRQTACEVLLGMGERAATNEVITSLINALSDKESPVRQCACKALGNMGEKAITNEVITSLINALRDHELLVRIYACDTLGKMCTNGGAEKVIVATVNAVAEKVNDWEEQETKVLEQAMSFYAAIKRLDSHTLCKLNSCIRGNDQIQFSTIPPDQFFKLFLETRDDAYLSLATYVALIQGIAVTLVENKIIIYHMNKVLELDVWPLDLTDSLLKAFQEQQKELQICAVTQDVLD